MHGISRPCVLAPSFEDLCSFESCHWEDISVTGRKVGCSSLPASGGGGRGGCEHWVGRVGQPHLLTAQLAFVFSLGTVLVEVTGLPELKDCPIPASEGTLQGHLGARGRSWRAHRDTTLVSSAVPQEGCREASLRTVHSSQPERTLASVWAKPELTPGGGEEVRALTPQTPGCDVSGRVA